jgi:hypothetical protein
MIRFSLGYDGASKRRSTSIETSGSRLASERPPKDGVASKKAFRSVELTAIELIYVGLSPWQAGQILAFWRMNGVRKDVRFQMDR